MKRVDAVTFISYSKVFCLCLVAFYSMMPYFWWDKSIILLVFNILLFGVSFIQYSIGKNYEHEKMCKKGLVCFGAFLIFYVYQNYFWGMGFSIVGICSRIVFFLFPVFIMLFCSDKEKVLFLDVFTKFIAAIFSVSLVFYFLYLAGIYKSSTKLYHPTNSGYGAFNNFKFFILCRGETIVESIFPRFQSVITEPGHLGMMSALLLYANNYKIKRPSVLVLLISLLFSLSGSGYALFVFGIILHLYFKSKKKIIALFVAVFVGTAIVGGSLVYYNAYPDSVISKRIIHRFMPDKKRGIAGNNRNTEDFKREYSEFVAHGGIQFVIGKGPNVMEKYTWGNSSYKNFVLQYGLVGFILLWGFYASIVYINQTQLALGMLLLWMLSFVQRPYATWNSQIFIFVSAATLLKTYQSNHSNEVESK